MPSLLLRALALCLACGCAGAPAQPRAPDTLDQRLKACAACHGDDGQGLQGRNEYFPRLAGKPAGYLVEQLLNFRERRREAAVMNYMVSQLSDEYLQEIAAHYAGRHPPLPAPTVRAAPDVLAAGERLVHQGDRARGLPACAACHGRTLTGAEPAIPGLVGLHPPYIGAQLGAWQAGMRRARAPDCMAEIARKLVPSDVAAITAYLSAQPASADARPAPPGSIGKLPLACGSVEPAAPVAAPPEPAADSALARGRYLAALGNCAGCHTQRGGAAYAGGPPLRTPFGTLYGPNLTPDVKHGLGAWSADDFWRAMHDGRSKDGKPLYPAFPYTHYSRVTRADSDALFAWLKSLPPVAQAHRAHELRFPYDLRPLLWAWRTLYFDRPAASTSDARRPAEWQRGAYLVEGLGHCNACHAPRNWLGASRGGGSGALIPMQNWYAPALAGPGSIVAGASVDELAELLGSGVSTRGNATGPMASVVRHSLQHATAADLRAMAVYLKSQDASAPAPTTRATPPPVETAQLRAGQKLYDDRCADCHGGKGDGVPRVYPPLAGNAGVLQANPVNAIRIVLNGGFAPSTRANPRPYGMPPYYQALSDEDIAAVLTYVRQSWGNAAAPVDALAVQRSRGVPVD